MSPRNLVDGTKINEHIRGRVGSALLRVASLKERVSGSAAESPRTLTKVQEDLRKLAEELEQGFLELQEAMSRCTQAQHAAAAAGQRAHLLIEVAPFACLLVDCSGTIVQANPAAGRALNVSHGRLPGKPFLLFVNGERELFLARLTELLRHQHPSRWVITLQPREQSLAQVVVVAVPQAHEQVMLLLLPAQGKAVDIAGGQPEPPEDVLTSSGEEGSTARTAGQAQLDAASHLS